MLFSLLLSFFFPFVCVSLFVANVVVVVVVVVVIVVVVVVVVVIVVMFLPTYFLYRLYITSGRGGTSPFSHSCTPLR